MKRCSQVHRPRRTFWNRPLIILSTLSIATIIAVGWISLRSSTDSPRTPQAPPSKSPIVTHLPPRSTSAWTTHDVATVLSALDRLGKAHDKDDEPRDGVDEEVRRWVPAVDEYFARHGLPRLTRTPPPNEALSTVDGMLFVAYVSAVYPSLAMILGDHGGHRDALYTAGLCLRQLLRLTRHDEAAVEDKWRSSADDPHVAEMMHRVAPQRRDWGRLRDRLALRRAAVLEELIVLEPSITSEVHAEYLFTFIVVLRGCEHGMRNDYKGVVPRSTNEKSRFVEDLLLRWCQSRNVNAILWKKLADLQKLQKDILDKGGKEWVVPGIAPFDLDEIVEATRPTDI